MPDEQHGIAPCKTCRQPTIHTTIRPVSRGQTYLRCSACGSVTHFTTPPKERPS